MKGHIIKRKIDPIRPRLGEDDVDVLLLDGRPQRFVFGIVDPDFVVIGTRVGNPEPKLSVELWLDLDKSNDREVFFSVGK